MRLKISRLSLVLVVVAAITAIPGLPLDVDLRGNWLLLHLLIASPLAALLVVMSWFVRGRGEVISTLAWLCLSIAMGVILIPMLGLTSAETSHNWITGHGWLSFLGFLLLGWSAARRRNAG